MDSFRFYLAAEKIYHYSWHTFADIIIEESKNIFKETKERADSRKNMLLFLLKEQLKILHPFMPFITEKLWSILEEKGHLLMVESWPKY